MTKTIRYCSANGDSYGALAFDFNERGSEGDVEDAKEEVVVDVCCIAVGKVAGLGS